MSSLEENLPSEGQDASAAQAEVQGDPRTQIEVAAQPVFWRRRVPLAWLIIVAVVLLVFATTGAWLVFSPQRPMAQTGFEDRSMITSPPPPARGTILPVASTAFPTPVQLFPTPTSTTTAPILTALSATASPTRQFTSLLVQAEGAFQQAIVRRDAAGFGSALDLVIQSETGDPGITVQAAALRSRIYRAMDVVGGTVYLGPENTARWDLSAGDGPLINPIDFTIGPTGLYVVDRGTIYSASLPSPTSGSGKVSLTTILTPTAWIGGYPVKEAVALDAVNTKDALFVLDKSGDVYRYTPSSRTWRLEDLAANRYTNPDPAYLSIATYTGDAERLYLLDPGRNQIWRQPPNQLGAGFLPGKFPWLLAPGEPDVSDGLDLSVDRDAFVLRRDGTVDRYFLDKSFRLQQNQFSLAVADGRSHILEMEDQPIRPVAILASKDGVPVYVADSGRRRVVALHRETGVMLGQFAAPDNPDFSLLHGIAEWDGWLYLLAGTSLYGFDMRSGITATLPATGQLPAWKPWPFG